MGFEDITYESLMKDKLLSVSANKDRRESSVIYNAIAANSAETIQMYVALKMLENRTYADTAVGKDLERRTFERGIKREAATKAILKGVFKDTNGIAFNIALNSRFSGDELNYIATEKIEDGVFKLQSETIGEPGNTYLGTLIPINYIKGLATAELTELLIPAENEESDEALRARYFNSFDNQAFGGNIADYKQKTNAIAGVGGTKVYPVWNGGGTVKLVIIDSTYNIPTVELIEAVQTSIDPEANQGMGLGLAPIGHKVTVEGVRSVAIKVTSTIALKNGYVWEDVQPYINKAIEQYFLEIRKTWADEDTLIIRISQIETRILAIAGILDVQKTLLNGESFNFILGANEVPILGEVIKL
jgi:uncharacterized phage protein gp47/JayE